MDQIESSVEAGALRNERIKRMDMIEYAIFSLGRQAGVIADEVPNSKATQDLLHDAADLLGRAAGKRHDDRNSGRQGRVLDDDTPEAQRKQLDAAEKVLVDRGVGAVINSAPLAKFGFETPPTERSISTLPLEDLLAIWVNVMRELKEQGVVRSTNRPLVGDYAEMLAASALGAKRPDGPDRGVDLVAGERRFQVKARMDPLGRPATHFDISNLDDHRFDVFVGFVFDEHLQVRDAWEVDWELLRDLASPKGSKHTVRIKALDQNFRADGGVRQLEL
jgi:hypothetical protein